MLGLDDTAMLLDGLKPPPGMEIDAAVGTTFTLDLAALLAVPVAATFATEESEEDSASVLETIRRYADRTVLFCQAGAISIPPKYRAALSFVEQTVVEVRKPSRGIFHPKAWIVRFAGRGRALHRVLVMSRNLTLDRSWDVIVQLDEDPTAERAVRKSGILAFLSNLPHRAARDLKPGQAEMIDGLAESLRAARLAVPEPFDTGSFVYLRGNGSRQPFSRSCDHALAISPFLTTTAAQRFVSTATHWAEVVSRPAALDSAVAGLRDADRLRRLKDTVVEAARTVDDTFDSTDNGELVGSAELRGLHAKVYVQDDGARATTWLGSANLTTGAFSTNVELLVALSGPTAQVGVDAVLAQEPVKGNLASLLEDHPLRQRTGREEDDEETTTLEGHLFDVASGEVTLTLVPAGAHWDARLEITPWALPEGFTVRARLLSLENDQPVEVVDGVANWEAITEARITPFVVLEARLEGSAPCRALVRAHLIGDPEERRRSVIANAITSREDFLRYLAALLGVAGGAGIGTGEGTGFAGTWSGIRGDRILEDLLATASREPSRLAHLEETIQQLQRRPDLADVVPKDFRELWDAVYAARRGVIP